MTDHPLAARIAAGDPRALARALSLIDDHDPSAPALVGALYRQTGAHLYAVVLRIVRDKSIAEEILQEAYVNVWHHAGSYDAARE